MIADDMTHLCAERALTAKPSAIREICKLIDSPGMKSLAGGWPDPASFPNQELANIIAELLQTNAGQVLQYGTTEGLLPLRQELAQYMANKDDISCTAEHVLITHGSAQGMDLACRVLIDPGDVIMVGLPTYFGGTGTIKANGGELAGVPVDDEGINIDLMEQHLHRLSKTGRRVKGVYVIPNFQNPTGATLSLPRRLKLLELAEAFDLVIFEDDPYIELRYEGERLPPLMALAKSSRVIHLRSGSKIFAPGLRLGWAVAHSDLIRKMTVAKQFVDCATNTLSQHIFLAYMQKGIMARQIKANNAYYQEKRDFMLEQLQRNLPAACTWNRPAGGFFIFVHLPAAIDSVELLREAVQNHVAFVAGTPFFIDGSGHNSLRLSYSQATQTDIAAATEQLGQLIHKHLNVLGTSTAALADSG